MLLQETLTAVMVAENTVVSKFVLSDTSYVLPERTKMSGHCPEERRGRRDLTVLTGGLKLGERGPDG